MKTKLIISSLLKCIIIQPSTAIADGNKNLSDTLVKNKGQEGHTAIYFEDI